MKIRIISILTLCLCLCVTAKVHAQYVSIPDTNFGTWLNYSSLYSGCVTGNNNVGWRLDTTCYNVSHPSGALSCYNAHIHDLTGIAYFKYISVLDCSGNSISSIATLPRQLSQLYCRDNQLTSLPALPATLSRLECGGNPLGSLPSLPASLTYLVCNGDGLTTLPALPIRLKTLICSSNQLTSLPTLPDSVTMLYCDYNPLTALPAMPAQLANLNCRNDLLTQLPAMPVGLLTLRCAANQLTSLPTLSTPFQYLDCDSNALTSLPALPTTLGNVGGGLVCSHNPDLYCLPSIDTDFIAVFHIAGSGITCLPNRFTAYDYDMDPAFMPLCSFASGCPSHDNIEGHVYNDTAAICPLDSLHPGLPLHYAHVLLRQNGQVVQQCFTSVSGEYSFAPDVLMPYTVEVDTAFLPFTVVCPAADTIQAVLSATDSTAYGLDFGLRCNAPDYGVGVVVAGALQPGDTTVLHIIAGNPLLYWYGAICGAGAQGTVTTVLSRPVRYIGPAPHALTPVAVSGDTITYRITALDSLGIGSLDVLVATDTTATTGDAVCISAGIHADGGDIYAQDDTMTRCFSVVSSFDPNHKLVDQAYIAGTGEWLTYTIAFQNTGAATAHKVVVTDRLSSSVSPESFALIAADHEVLVQLSGDMVTFSFPGIDLADSATDPAKSTGWVQYRVRSNPGLPLQTQIRNTAYIYFDYNAAITTNTAITTVGAPNGITAIKGSNIKLYPNPNRGSFTIENASREQAAYTITDILGHLVASGTAGSAGETVSLPELANGIYTLQAPGASPVRFVVMH